MAHTPKPFYRSARSAFYVQLGKRQVKLAAGPNDPATEKLAWAAFHRLMAAAPAGTASDSANTALPAPATGLTVAAVFDKFLDWCQAHRSARSYEFYRDRIQSFCDHLKTAAVLPAAALKPFHVQEWVDAKPTWGANQRRGAVVSVTRPFSWAAKLGYLAANPVKGVDKPAAQKRESTLTPAAFDRLLALVTDGPFRDLLTFAHAAGVRPQEARQVEARHVHLGRGRIEIPPAEAKGKRRWRVIYLSDAAAAVLAPRLAAWPTGPVFRNADGNPWTAQALVCRFQRLLVKMAGADQALPPLPRFDRRRYQNPAELAAARAAHQAALVQRRRERARLARRGSERYAMYDLRHLFATRKLKAGHDPITVAALLGHKDGAMLCKHYEQLSTDGEHLRAAAQDGCPDMTHPRHHPWRGPF